MTCKPRPISGNLPFDAIAKDYNRYCDRIVGNVLPGVTPVVSFLLQTDLSPVTGQPVTLTDGQLLDTVEEGIVEGSFAVAGDKMTITDNRFTMSSPSTANNTDGGVTNGVPFAVGQGFFFEYVPSTTASENQAFMGISDAATINFSDELAAYFRATPGQVDFYRKDAAYNQIMTDLVGNIAYKFALIPSIDKTHLFIKGGVYTTWTRLFITDAVPVTTMYGHLNAVIDGVLKNKLLRIPEIDFTSDVTPLQTLSGVIQTAVSDVVIEGDFITPASGIAPAYIKFRQSDADNYLAIKITPGIAGSDTQLVKVEATVESVLASADVDYAISTSYHFHLVCDGSDLYRLHIDSSLPKITYTTSETFNQTETGVSVDAAIFTGVVLGAYKRVDNDNLDEVYGDIDGLSVSVIGDSITMGYTASNWDTTSYPAVLRTSLQNDAGNGGEGFLSMLHSDVSGGASTTPQRWTFTGVWSKEYDATMTGQGAIAGGMRTSDVGALAEIDFFGDSIKVMFGTNHSLGGTGNIYIDNVLQGAIDCFGTGVDAELQYGQLEIFATTLGNHTLKIERSSGFLFMEGVVPTVIGNGSTVHRFGKGWMRADWLGQINDATPASAYFQSMKSCVDALITDKFVIALGINDYIHQVPLATFNTRMTTLIQKAQVKGEVYILAMPQPDSTEAIPYSDYVAELSSVAVAEGVTLIDIYTRWGSAFKSIWMADLNHPNDLGHNDIGTAVYDVVS